MLKHLLALSLLAIAPVLLAAAPPAIHAEDWGMVFRGADARVLGLDGAFSLPVSPGKALWSFGDTLLGDALPSGDRRFTAMPFNTAAIASNQDVLAGAAHATFLNGAEPVLPGAPVAAHRVWPLDMVSANKRWYHYFVTIAPKGHGPLDFEVVGTGLAVAEPGPNPRFGQPRALWPGEAPSFGASALVRGDWLYVYAGGAETHVARVPVAKLDRAEAYTYYAGPGKWRPSWREAAPLPGSGPELSVRWNGYLKAYVMIYVPPFGKTIEARFAPAPEGPWSAPSRVSACQPADDAVAMFYGAKQHVELDVDRGRQIFLTYNTNAPSDRLDDRPDLYWPRLVRVTFSR